METEFYKSKKWWAAILAPIISALAAIIAPKIGIPADSIVTVMGAILGVFGVYIAGQSYVDASVRSSEVLASAALKKK